MIGAGGVLINVTGGADLGLLEINEAAELVQKAVDPEANIIFGAVIDENLHDEIVITVIATGFNRYSSGDIKISDLMNGIKPEEAGEPAPQTGFVSKTQQKQDYVVDWDIPPFLRKNKD